ncbi:MAG: sigma-70 family RNA polymerase sigma factor [Myxococcales bacterium]
MVTLSTESVFPSEGGRVDTDADLARGLLSQRPDAAELVRQRFAPLVRRWFRRGLGPDADLEDLEQEAFLRIFGGIHRLRDPEALRIFVITVVKRTLGRELRRKRRREGLFVSHEPEAANVIGEVADPAANHAFCHFRCLLERLCERDRRAFVLRFAAGLETEQVAEALGVSMPTARRSFTRAKSRVTTWAGRHPFLSEYLASELPST